MRLNLEEANENWRNEVCALKNVNMKHIIVIILLLSVTFSCKPTVPADYIQPSDMEDILYDYHVAQAMGREGQKNSLPYDENGYFQAVLRKYQVTEAEFDSSFVYYYSHAERLKKI